MNRRSKILLGVFTLVVLVGILAVVAYQKNFLPAINLSNKSWLEGKDKNLAKKDDITQDLPTNASTVRLNLPTSISNLMIGKKTGVGGLGVETDDPAVYSYVWMDIKADTKINSLASGTVTQVKRINLSEYNITVNYSYGLWAEYYAIAKPLVKEGDNVREGQEIGIGLIGSQPNSNILAFAIADENIKEGTQSPFSPGMIVKPLDYLKPDVKVIILGKYK